MWWVIHMGWGCAAPEVPPSPLDVALSRRVHGPVTTRASLQARSEVLGLGARSDAVIMLERPGRAHIGVLGPLGGARAALHVDGPTAAIRLPRTRRHVLAGDADRVLRESTGGLLDLDAAFGLLVGELPVSRLPPIADASDPSGRSGVFRGPRGVRVVVEVEASGAPRAVSARAEEGTTLFSASWGPFAGDPGARLPESATVRLPSLDLDLDVHFGTWTADPIPEAAFDVRAPEGWTEEPVEVEGRRLAGSAIAALLRALDHELAPSDTVGTGEE